MLYIYIYIYIKIKVYVNFFSGFWRRVTSHTISHSAGYLLFLVTLDQLESSFKKKKKNPQGSDEFFDIKLNRYLYKY